MDFLRDIPIRRKLTILTMLTSCAALLLACVAILAFEQVTFRKEMVDDLITTARMTGDNSAAALIFDDPSSAELTLKSLSADRSIVAGVVYDKAGKPFASYSRAGAQGILETPPVEPEGHHFGKNRLDLFCNIERAGETAGTVYIRSDLEEMRNRSWKYSLIVGVVMVVSSGVAFLLSTRLQAVISRPIADLARIAGEVASGKDYSLRAEKQGDDELGHLINGFNQMLGQIQQRDAALESARHGLEKRVRERTGELANSLALLNATLDSTADGIVALRFSGEVICYNTNFAAMWKIPIAVLEEKNSRSLVKYCAMCVRNPQEFSSRLEELNSRLQSDVSDVIDLIDGRTFERFAKVQRVDGESVGMVISYRDVTERKRAEAELDKAHKQLLEASHQAGMAEVATSVLHNVGNVLNSVNVSCSVISENIRRSRISSVGTIAGIITANSDDLPEFFRSHPTGRKLPEFLEKLAVRLLLEEQNAALGELQLLGKNIGHIKDIVAVQQSYARNVGGVRETLPITTLIDDALRMNDGGLSRHGVLVVREFSEAPPVPMEKHKVLQILVNLVRNAKHALTDSGRPDKQLLVSVGVRDDHIAVTVTDNGIGISPENMTRIFAHGFTTKKNGHGFGLHSGVLAAQEMGGKLVAHSAGLGSGASFVLELPLRPAAAH